MFRPKHVPQCNSQDSRLLCHSSVYNLNGELLFFQNAMAQIQGYVSLLRYGGVDPGGPHHLLRERVHRTCPARTNP